MKKLFCVFAFFVAFLSFGNVTLANEKVIFNKCVDGDTFSVKINGENKTVRLLAVDTPESVHPNKKVEFYGKEASNFTCDLVKNAKNIELEYDSNSDKTDKYGRVLAWVFVDSQLLQDLLIKDGYAEVAYLYGNYKYVDLLKDHQAIAESKQIGVWNEEEREKYNSDNDISDDIEDVDDNFSDDDIKNIINDAIDKVQKRNIDYKNISFDDIKYIAYVFGAALVAILFKKKSSKKK